MSIFLFILALLLLVVGIGALLASFRLKDRISEDRFGDPRTVSLKTPRRILRAVGAAALALMLLPLSGATVYQQDPGEANVLRSVSGEVVGQDLDEGFGIKAPWVEAVTFDIRNQRAEFIGNGTTNNSGGVPTGTQISTTDADGVSVNLDVIVQYSVQPDAVSDIYADYQTQNNFRDSFINNWIRSVSRDVPNTFTTLEVLTQRGEVRDGIDAALRARWEGTGVVVENVTLQDVRYSDEVRASFDAAQQARINVETEEANLAAAEVRAQTRVAEANAQAEANRILTESLTEDVLAQRYLDTLTEVGQGGNLIVVPSGFEGILNLPGQNRE